MGDAFGHQRLGGEMHGAVEVLLPEEFSDGIPVPDIADGESLSMHEGQMAGGEIVEDPDPMALVQQPEDGRTADVPGASRDQNPKFCARSGVHESAV